MKKFSSYLKEFLVITFSVTIAFWMENYRESRNDDQITKELLVKLSSDLKAEEGYLSSLIESAEIHSKRFDTLLNQLKDCQIVNNQLLIEISLAYLPYVTDISESSSFESLKNSGLISNIKNDSLVPDLFFTMSQIKRNLHEYNEAWKKSQERVRNVLPVAYGNRVTYDFDQSKLILSDNAPIHLKRDECDKLAFEIVSWITIMKQHSIWLRQHQFDLLNYRIPQLEATISAF